MRSKSVRLLALIAATSAWLTGPPARCESDAVFDGMARLYSLETVTVVYPSGEGEIVALNRLSAERRAAYLSEGYGVRTNVLPDGEMAPEQLGDHLLVLGWNNRLLGTDESGRPYSDPAPERRFLSQVPVYAGEDLLFISASPFDPEKLMVFWSRIDLELERLNPLPFLGSDWAVYADYQVVHQGIFANAPSWPPVRNPGAEASHRSSHGAYPRQRASEHYRLHHADDAFTEDQQNEILEAREAALAKAASLLGLSEVDLQVRLVVYSDAETKEERTGVPDLIHSMPTRRQLHMVHAHAIEPRPHEEIHLLGRQLYGPAYLTALYEGLAFALEDNIRGVELGVHAGFVLEQGRVPTVAELLDEEGLRTLPRNIRFTAAALFVDWLRSVASEQAFRSAYRWSNAGMDDVAAMLSLSADEVQAGYESWVQRRAAGSRSEIAFQKALVEARESFRQGNFHAVVTALTRAIEARPNHPQVLLDLASAELRVGEYELAETHLGQLLELPLRTDQAQITAFAHLQLGRVHDILGRRELAVERYNHVLELPDLYGSHQLARQAIAEPVTAESLR